MSLAPSQPLHVEGWIAGGRAAGSPFSQAAPPPPPHPRLPTTYGVDARQLLAQLQDHRDDQGLPVGVAAQQLEQGQRALPLQLPLLLLQLGQRARHVGPASQALQTYR